VALETAAGGSGGGGGDGRAAALGDYKRCNCGRPTFCLRPIATKVPVGPWFCPDCAPPLKRLKSELLTSN